MIPDWDSERQNMVETQLRRRGIRDPRVLAAMGQIPREAFVPPEARVASYQDAPVYIGWGQTISQPYMTALMAELLDLEGSETVLDVGAGSGYHAAVLGALAARVVSVEIVPALAAIAADNLARSGYGGNVTVVVGDGSAGWPEGAPYNAISVAAGAPEVPPALLDQLAQPGRLVIPVGPMEDQELLVIHKKADGAIDRHVAGYCRFVPLRGGGGWR